MLKFWSLIIPILTKDLALIYGFTFVTKPENKTFLHGQSLYFNCSSDVNSASEMDWVYTSFLRPLSEQRIVEWHQGGFRVERPNNFTCNLVILNPNSTLAGKYCCRFRNGHGGNSCAFAKEINLPQNEVVLPGSNVLLNCAQVRAYRWFRFLPTALSDDKVIYMGSKMAYDADERFRVYTAPDANANPYDRLDLYISDVTTDLFGTYKCQQPGAAHCAELIVLDSQPVCDVHLVKKLGLIVETAELSCRIKVTENAEPDMLCGKNTTEYQRQSVCSRGPDGVVTCTAEVAVDKLPDISCTIKFNPKPLQKYMTCIHVSNQPSYTYKWTPYSDEMLQLYSIQFTLIAIIIALLIICIFIIIPSLVYTMRKRVKDVPVGLGIPVQVCSDSDLSNSTNSTESESLTHSVEVDDYEEKPNNPDNDNVFY